MMNSLSKIIEAIARWLFILCLPVLLLTASIGGAINSLWLYNYGFEKYHISQTTGLAPAELEKAARGLIAYFNSSEPNISITVVKDGKPFDLFNERETIHLRDVKELMRLDYKVLLGTLLYALAYAVATLFRRKWRQLARALVWGGSLTLGLGLLLGAGILLGFDQLFIQFHLLSFSNDFWQLDPTRDYLVMLFPGGFWYDAATFCTLGTLGMAVVLGGTGAWLLRVNKSAG